MQSMWNLPAPRGFQGLRDDLSLTCYEQALPHWRQNGATYFVTFRLGDSLPEAKLRELRGLKAEWERRHPPPRSRAALDEMSRETLRRIERWLDEGMGGCCLRDPANSRHVVEAMIATADVRCEIGCWVVMPNHVHAVVRPLSPKDDPLEEILKSWKGRSARWINLETGETGSLWQRESYDRIVRDEEHLWRVIQYIGRNPRNAKLRENEYRLWMNPVWIEQGWNFEPAS